MIILLALSVIAISVGIGCYVSKSKFDNSITDLSSGSSDDTVDSENLQTEIDRIDELKNNLREVKENVDALDIPTPESVSYYDDAQSSLNKLSRFFEEHSSATVGTEQLILSLLPSSQLGESLHSLAQIVPPDVGHAVFGDALSALKDGVHSIPTTEFLHRFVEGSSHLSSMAMLSMRNAMEHHDILGACLTPIKSGAMEALGVHDATHNLVNSLHDVGNEMLSSASTVDVGDLTSMTDVDITGHVPVITIALSSFREFQLLSDDKTDYITSLKNIALDAVGAGGGAIVGAKGGAIAGSFFGPIGTIVGGILGGIGGAIGGRAITNNIKTQPLKNAIAEYESQYSLMKSETEEKSRETARNIKLYAEDKRDEFHESKVLEDIPIVDTEQTISQIALILFQFVVNELMEMKSKTKELRKSIWYSGNKYDSIIESVESEIKDMENQLPPVEFIRTSPETAIDVLLNLNMPNRKVVKAYQDKINECSAELKTLNDKNNSAVLVWSYMVNNLYQNTLNDIAEYSNGQMNALNDLFGRWKSTLSEIEGKISVEKGKLGL